MPIYIISCCAERETDGLRSLSVAPSSLSFPSSTCYLFSSLHPHTNFHAYGASERRKRRENEARTHIYIYTYIWFGTGIARRYTSVFPFNIILVSGTIESWSAHIAKTKRQQQQQQQTVLCRAQRRVKLRNWNWMEYEMNTSSTNVYLSAWMVGAV